MTNKKDDDPHGDLTLRDVEKTPDPKGDDSESGPKSEPKGGPKGEGKGDSKQTKGNKPKDTKEPSHGIKEGDEVLYVPHTIHGRQQNLDGDYTWVWGLKRQHHRVVRGRAEVYEDVEELDDRQTTQQLDLIHRHPDPESQMRNLVPIRPRRKFKAIVRAVNEDETVNLDIQGDNGVTLHYDNVRVSDVDDEEGVEHHTCHAKTKKHKSKKEE